MLANLTQKTVAKDILLKKEDTYTFELKKLKFIYLYMVPLPQSQISCHKFYNNIF